ncbi:DUF3604 domain-containing protein [Steroidobacter flavus]|uniref:DUF3604 domain-containing protein n=1 Tax=Steroidobacter flavus TaxID=1842136 RepID=A0ABV8SY13_9GAMM
MSARILFVTTAMAGVAASVAGVATAAEPAREPAPAERRAFFGELHLHTALSLDAWTYGTKLLPEDAYRFGRGDTVMVPATQVAREQGADGKKEVAAKRAWPLDFMAVTDHSELVGTMLALDDPKSDFANSEAGKRILADPPLAQRMYIVARRGRGEVPPQMKDPARIRDAWERTVRAANDFYAPGKFTTFIGYEWSALPDGKNLHRNVIFNSTSAPLPFDATQSQRPEDLWTYIESVRARGMDVIAIPHNGNASGGLMFDWNMSDGRPIDQAYAMRRASIEPLTEIAQIKGQSETVPMLSPNDEFANFEVLDRLLGPAGVKSAPPGSYIRDAFGRGLVIQSGVGANPFKYGVIGSSDIHNALSASDEAASAGGQFGIDPQTMLPRGEFAKKALGQPTTPQKLSASALALPEVAADPKRAEEAQRLSNVERSSAGLAGVWANENTRESIFAALKRKETFATSGTRVRVRMFGGWDFERELMKRKDWVAQAYAHGVPMGADMPAKPAGERAPKLLVQATKDPEGANLDRIQVIKVWLEGGSYKERIFDVAVSDGRKIDAEQRTTPLTSTVDLSTGEYRNSIGAAVLETVWEDPTFDPKQPVVYYARVLEIPTPRWSTLLAVKNQLPLSKDVPAIIQERAWSSPIWFTP